MSVTENDLDKLRDAYLEMKRQKAEIRSRVKERHRKLVEEEIAAETLTIERWFAVQLVNLRENGATRRELVSVIGDGSADTMRRYVELGGGKIQGRTTGEERRQNRIKNLGVKRVGTSNTFDVHVASLPDGEEVHILATVLWQDGKPYIWPVESGDVMRLRDDFGWTQSDLYAKGAEIVDVYNLVPPENN